MSRRPKKDGLAMIQQNPGSNKIPISRRAGGDADGPMGRAIRRFEA
jgi:hypothetical protein